MSRELDVQVARALGRAEPPTVGLAGHYWESNGDGTWRGEEVLRDEHGIWQRAVHIHEWPPYYSSNIAAAWELVDETQKADGKFSLHTNPVQGWQAHIFHGWDSDGHRIAWDGYGPIAPEAICRAFLAWKEAQGG